MSEFGGLWRNQNNPACSKSVNLKNVEVGHYTKKIKYNWEQMVAAPVSTSSDNQVPLDQNWVS